MTETATSLWPDLAGRLPRIPVNRARRLWDLSTVRARRRLAAARARFYDTMWSDAARAVGASCAPAAGGLHRIERRGLVSWVRRSDLMLDSALMLDLIGDKELCYGILGNKGFAVPRHLSFKVSQISDAHAFLAELGRPAVVKPALGTGGGRGVTTGVTGPVALRRAARIAAGYATTLLIEEQIAGASYRLLYLDGQFLDAVRRDPPQVTGDGRSSLRQLMAAETTRRQRAAPVTALSPLTADPDCRAWLESQGLSLAHRPAAGERVTVKSVVNENGADQNHSVRAEVHPSVVEDIGALVRDMGVRCAGVDLICADITVPLTDSGGVLGEINANPGLHHHYLIADPEAGVPVAREILTHIFEHRQGAIVL